MHTETDTSKHSLCACANLQENTDFFEHQMRVSALQENVKHKRRGKGLDFIIRMQSRIYDIA